jgi:hypothetical protein
MLTILDGIEVNPDLQPSSNQSAELWMPLCVYQHSSPHSFSHSVSCHVPSCRALPRCHLTLDATLPNTLHLTLAALLTNTLPPTFVGFGTCTHDFEGIFGKTSDSVWLLIRTRTTLRLHCPASALGAQRSAKVQQHRILACTRVLHRRRVPVVLTAYHKRERVVRAAAPLPSR